MTTLQIDRLICDNPLKKTLDLAEIAGVLADQATINLIGSRRNRIKTVRYQRAHNRPASPMVSASIRWQAIKRDRQWQAERAIERAKEEAREQEAAERSAELKRERANVLARLRKMGFKRECTSGRSAYYYVFCGDFSTMKVRVSDHYVPLTAERSYNLENGGRSWANSALSLVIGEESADEWLEDIKSRLEALGGAR